MSTHIIRAYSAQVDDIKPSERAVISRIGGMAIDRHRSQITPAGIDLAAYRQNPVVLHEHGRCPTRGTLPVGRNQWIKIDGDRMIAKTVFRDDPYSEALFQAYRDDWMRGWSINVIAHEASAPTDEERRTFPALRDECDIIYRRSELVEYSTTSMPSHREALTLMVSRGIWVPDEAVLIAQRDHARSTRTTVLMPGHSPPILSLPADGHDLSAEPDPRHPYGYCPLCGAKGVDRGETNDTCACGHVYPSSMASPVERTAMESTGLTGGGAAVKPGRVPRRAKAAGRPEDDDEWDEDEDLDEDGEDDDDDEWDDEQIEQQSEEEEEDEDEDEGETDREQQKAREESEEMDAEDEDEPAHNVMEGPPRKAAGKPTKRTSPPSVGRHVVKKGGKWYVLSKDRKKTLGGPYTSKAAADKRLGQIEYFKHAGRTSPTDVHKDPNAGKNSFKKNIREEDGHFVVTDDEGKHMGTYPTREEAEHRVKQIVWFKDHTPLKRDAWTDASQRDPVYPGPGGVWHVRGTDETFETEAIARKFHAAMGAAPRPLADVLSSLDREAERIGAVTAEEIRGFLDLHIYGKV